MSERMKNGSNLSRGEVWNMGVTCTQLGVSSPEELSSILILGSRLYWHHEDALRAVETLNRVIR